MHSSARSFRLGPLRLNLSKRGLGVPVGMIDAAATMSATLEQVTALHRYFLWADRMRVHSEEFAATRHPAAPAGPPSPADEEFFAHPYRSYWYAGTYVVIEGWRRLDLRDSEIDRLLKSPFVKALKRYRHGVFHFQPKYLDARFLEFTSAGGESATWIKQVGEAFLRWFLKYIEELEEEEPSNG